MVNDTSITLLNEVHWLDKLLNERIAAYHSNGLRMTEKDIRGAAKKVDKTIVGKKKKTKVMNFRTGDNPHGGPHVTDNDSPGGDGRNGLGEIWERSYPKSLADEFPPPNLLEDRSFYADFVRSNQLSASERLIMIMVLAPQIFPEIMEKFYLGVDEQGHMPLSYGLIIHPESMMIYPTIQTAVFILYGASFFNFGLFQDMSPDGKLCQLGAIEFDEHTAKDSRLSQRMYPTPDFLDSLLMGQPTTPRFGTEFPAKKINTPLEWTDLVLPSNVVNQLEEIHTWLEFHNELMNGWGMKKKLKPGYRALFYGPPGTGKTLTAALLGKTTGKPVFRIDLSMVVSKFIGETEKNLSRVFDAAEKKDWILFFDEADALFGKRTKVSDSHDRYANQEVSYLLQRVEEYGGLVILATNLKSNLDDAFTRRFQTIVHFPMPQSEERLRHWEDGISSNAVLDPEINLRQVAAKYELSGGAILNIIQYASLMALKQGDGVIRKKDLFEGIRREFSKEGRTI